MFQNIGEVNETLSSILKTSCSYKLTDARYSSTAFYREQFVESFFGQFSCYAGVIKGSIAKGKMIIDDSKYQPDKCKDQYIVRLNLDFSTHSHANTLIHSKGIIIRIEPNGETSWDNVVDDELQRYFNEKNNKKYGEYIVNFTTCPEGVQKVADDEFCVNWSLLLSYLLIRSPDKSIDDIQTELVARGPEYLRELMNHWHCFMEEYIHKTGIKKKFDDERARDIQDLLDNPGDDSLDY